jgi:hypothetical protein
LIIHAGCSGKHDKWNFFDNYGKRDFVGKISYTIAKPKRRGRGQRGGARGARQTARAKAKVKPLGGGGGGGGGGGASSASSSAAASSAEPSPLTVRDGLAVLVRPSKGGASTATTKGDFDSMRSAIRSCLGDVCKTWDAAGWGNESGFEDGLRAGLARKDKNIVAAKKLSETHATELVPKLEAKLKEKVGEGEWTVLKVPAGAWQPSPSPSSSKKAGAKKSGGVKRGSGDDDGEGSGRPGVFWYDGSDGSLLLGRRRIESFGPLFKPGDVVGVGRLYASGSAFFTLNGKWVGFAAGEGCVLEGSEYSVAGVLQPLLATTTNKTPATGGSSVAAAAAPVATDVSASAAEEKSEPLESSQPLQLQASSPTTVLSKARWSTQKGSLLFDTKTALAMVSRSFSLSWCYIGHFGPSLFHSRFFIFATRFITIYLSLFLSFFLSIFQEASAESEGVSGDSSESGEGVIELTKKVFIEDAMAVGFSKR